jgi:hypothetical protein
MVSQRGHGVEQIGGLNEGYFGWSTGHLRISPYLHRALVRFPRIGRPGYHAAVSGTGTKYLSHLVATMAGVAGITGCMATAEHTQIGLSYHSQAPIQRVPGAESIKVNVIAKDMRDNKEWVCAQSGHGYTTARQAVGIIESLTPPAALVSRALKAELSNRGFEIDYKGIPVVANVATFSCYRGGGSAVDAAVGIDLFVYQAGRPPNGREFFYRYVKGEYVDQGHVFRVWNGENAKTALEAALEDAMKQLFSDHRFIDTLLNPAVQAPLPSVKRTPPPPMRYTPN